MAITRAGSKRYLWEDGDLSWKLHSTQLIMHDAVKSRPEADEILILSARQLGKSFWAIVFALEWCVRNPGTIVRVLAPTLKQVADIVGDNLAPICANAPSGLVVRHKSDYRWQIGTSSLRLGALERAHVDNNRGGNASLIICEEGGFVPSDDYHYAVTSVIGPQLLRSGGRLIHVTSPSKDSGHYIHTEVLPKCKLTGTSFRYTIYDNPQITPEQIQRAMALCGGEDSEAWKREYLAEIIRDEEMTVIPSYSEERHVKEITLPEFFHPQVTIDFGGVRDKTVALLFTYDFLRNKYLWLKEAIFEPNTPTSVIVEGVRVMESSFGVKTRWADCHGQTQIDLQQEHGFEIAVPVKDDWQAGINALQVAFGQDRMEISPECKFLRQTLESGRFNKHKTDFERTKTLGHCDALAAMSYGYRMAVKENPYPVVTPSRDTTFVLRKDKPAIERVAESIQPRTFVSDFSAGSGVKRFGTFKK